ncbi:MAG: NADH-quinone oxidoreductase subunit H [Candidatus Heimdallarchaeota archaeon]
MSLPWFEIFVFPGFIFIFVLTLLFEQSSSRLYSRFNFSDKKQPMFIPLQTYYQLGFKGKKESLSTKSILQIIALIMMFFVAIFSSLLLPISIYTDFQETIGLFGGYSGINTGISSIISFEGDLLLFICLLLLFGVLIFFVQFFNEEKSHTASLKSTLQFIIFDIPLLLALAGPAIARKTLNISYLAEDIRRIVLYNKTFGFIFLLPIGIFVSITSLTFKFDQAFFDKINSKEQAGIKSPLTSNWKRIIFNLAVRIMEVVVAGVIVAVFLGGAYLPLPITESSNLNILIYALNFIFKTGILLLISTFVKIMLPRLKFAQANNITWKLLTPIAICSIILISSYTGIYGLH